MSEMIDRVAQIINRAGVCDWRLETCRAGKCQCKVLARETIESMREPTGEMLNAIAIDIDTWAAERIWQKMIDGATK